MTWRQPLRIAALGAGIASSAVLAAGQRGQISSCGGAVETINWTREKLARPGVTAAAMAPILSYLELATQSCATDGDLWYYRYLLERRLDAGANKIAYSRRKAEEWHSEALGKQVDPFAPPPVQPRPPGPVARKWALVVGIGDFVDPTIVPLSYSPKDARDLRGALTDQAVGFAGDRVRLLVDGDATLVNVREGIGWLRANAGPDDLVVLYIASHGSPRQFDPNGVSYILMHDTETESPEKLYATALQMIDLSEVLSRDFRAGRVVLILDTCYSGDAARLHADPGTTGAFAPALEAFSRSPGRAIIAAAGGDQLSWESRERQNGYFTFFLVNALRSGHGKLPLQELFGEIQQNVTAAVQREQNTAQTPLMSGSATVKELSIAVAEAARPAP